MMRFATADYSFRFLVGKKRFAWPAIWEWTASTLPLSGPVATQAGRGARQPIGDGREGAGGREAQWTGGRGCFWYTRKRLFELCPNHPDAGVRRASREYFRKLVDFAAACGAVHLSSLPGIAVFDSEGFDSSFARCIEELGWRQETAGISGVGVCRGSTHRIHHRRSQASGTPGPIGSRPDTDS